MTYQQLRANERDPAKIEKAYRDVMKSSAEYREAGLALGARGSAPRRFGMQRHVVKLATVIDWSASVVGGVGAA